MKEISRISWELPLRAERPGAAVNPLKSGAGMSGELAVFVLTVA